MLWLHKRELQKSTEPYYTWNNQKCHEGTHCLLQIHEVRMGMIFQQIGSHSLPSKFLAPQRSEIQMPSTIACKYKLGIVEMQETFSHRSQDSSSVKPWSTQSSVFQNFLTKCWKGREKVQRCAINYIYLYFCFSLEPTQFIPKALGSETLCILHNTQVLREKCRIQKVAKIF